MTVKYEHGKLTKNRSKKERARKQEKARKQDNQRVGQKKPSGARHQEKDIKKAKKSITES